MFLKPCNLTLRISLSAEATQVPIMVKPTEYEGSGFKTKECVS